jgi:D-alanyl-D-alanine carboxypeptidase
MRVNIFIAVFVKKLLKNYFFTYAIVSGIVFIAAACSSKYPIVNTDEVNADSTSKAESLINDFMAKYHVPGMSVAIAKDGKLVFTKGYGYADTTAKEKVTPSSLFRIASVSKPVTSVAIMQLIESGRLLLNAKVFGEGGILGNEYGTPPYKSSITKITIHELLQHTCGGWSNNRNDPMFGNPSFSASQLISFTLYNAPLENEPGKVYAYSNFGYCVLGRVIEKVTGMSYEEYVKTSVLQKAGINDMQIGGNTLAERKSNEVVYYGQAGENPYLYNISRMDAHGGWIATAPDLLKFMLCVDGFSTSPDILKDSSIKLMTTPSTANKNYACGWAVDSANNWWHGGSLPGTGSEMVRAHNGFCWAILLNTRTWQENFPKDMHELIWHVVNDSTIQWHEQ